MIEMIERVARATYAMCPIYDGSRSAVPWEHPMVPESMRRGLLQQAKVAIAAMREPTQKMINALDTLDYTADTAEAMDYWRAMIDAALDEAKEG